MDETWTVFSGDEFTISMHTEIKHMWVRKGSKPTCLTYINSAKIKIVGALNNLKGKVTIMNVDGINQHSFLKFLKKLLRYNKKVFLIVDNLRAHKTKIIKDFVKKNEHRLKLDFFPPYSPENNPSEQCWKAVKKDLIACRLFLSPNELGDRVKDYFKEKHFFNLRLERFLSP